MLADGVRAVLLDLGHRQHSAAGISLHFIPRYVKSFVGNWTCLLMALELYCLI